MGLVTYIMEDKATTWNKHSYPSVLGLCTAPRRKRETGCTKNKSSPNATPTGVPLYTWQRSPGMWVGPCRAPNTHDRLNHEQSHHLNTRQALEL